jgi:hypothetical protein
MIDDPIVEETHRVRSEIAAEFGGDVHKFFEYLRERERTSASDVVTLQPNEPEPATAVDENRPR